MIDIFKQWPRMVILVVALGPGLLMANGEIILNTPAGNPLTNKEQSGFVDQLVGQALTRLGYRLKVEHLPGERALLLANSGVADGELLRIGGLQKRYTDLIQVPEKTFDMEFMAFARNKDLQINNWDDLKKYSVAIITGWKILENNIPEGVDLIKVKNPQQLFELASKGRTDIILFSRWQGIAFTRENHYEEVFPVGSALATMEMYVYLHKKHHALVPELAQAIRDMKQDGNYRQLYQKILEPLSR